MNKSVDDVVKELRAKGWPNVWRHSDALVTANFERGGVEYVTWAEPDGSFAFRASISVQFIDSCLGGFPDYAEMMASMQVRIARRIHAMQQVLREEEYGPTG